MFEERAAPRKGDNSSSEDNNDQTVRRDFNNTKEMKTFHK